jgi:succinate-semialdehyde dehydrogenase / glutarate-semialdehyde dehydrogenase
MRRGFFIDGKWRQPKGVDRFEVNEPATGRQVGSVLLADDAIVDEAVAAAERVALSFARTEASWRAAILLKAAALIEEREQEMAVLLTREQGKPIADNRKEIRFGAEVLRYYAGEAVRIEGSIRPASSAEIRNHVIYQPIGVCAAIVPWNYPVDLYCWKVGPAIAAGCPIIMKSPHETPFALAMLVECLHEAGLPPGCLADLPGLGPVAGAALARHPRVRMISATASVAAGQDIMRNASGNLKRVNLELGGHAPFIVLPDADIGEAASAAHRRSFSNMGQICITVNRILVARKIHAEFAECLAELAERTEIGDGLEEGVKYGPVLNSSVIERVEAHKSDAIAKGGKVIAGGYRPQTPVLSKGYFYRPTVIDDAPMTSLPMTEETYGPLAAIAAYDTLEELMAMANGLEYGLAAYVYGRNLELAYSIAEDLEFGAVGVNVNDTSELQAPFGGWKMSGIGRELGPEGLHAYLEPKHIKVRIRTWKS